MILMIIIIIVIHVYNCESFLPGCLRAMSSVIMMVVVRVVMVVSSMVVRVGRGGGSVYTH